MACIAGMAGRSTHRRPDFGPAPRTAIRPAMFAAKTFRKPQRSDPKDFILRNPRGSADRAAWPGECVDVSIRLTGFAFGGALSEFKSEFGSAIACSRAVEELLKFVVQGHGSGGQDFFDATSLRPVSLVESPTIARAPEPRTESAGATFYYYYYYSYSWAKTRALTRSFRTTIRASAHALAIRSSDLSSGDLSILPIFPIFLVILQILLSSGPANGLSVLNRHR